jgi:hypothetical protein
MIVACNGTAFCMICLKKGLSTDGCKFVDLIGRFDETYLTIIPDGEDMGLGGAKESVKEFAKKREHPLVLTVSQVIL